MPEQSNDKNDYTYDMSTKEAHVTTSKDTKKTLTKEVEEQVEKPKPKKTKYSTDHFIPKYLENYKSLSKEDRLFIQQKEAEIEKFIKDHKLLSKSDSILVAVSGGKDSAVLLHMMHKLFPGQLQALHYNSHIPDYSEPNVQNVKDLCKELNVKLHIKTLKEEMNLTLEEFRNNVLAKGKDLTYCNICGVLKRYFLNKFAKELGVDVIVTGHNADDLSQSFLMNLMRGRPEMNARIGPITGLVEDDRFIKRAKPLYGILENDLRKFSKLLGLPVFYDHCPYSTEAYRRYIKGVMNDYEKLNPEAKTNTVKSMLNLIPLLKEEQKNNNVGSPNFCKTCNEPTSGSVCAACQLIADGTK